MSDTETKLTHPHNFNDIDEVLEFLEQVPTSSTVDSRSYDSALSYIRVFALEKFTEIRKLREVPAEPIGVRFS